ncbi:Apical endosomal glycoprotein-like protein, partial [Leptotrombidium deliense]
MLHSILLSLPRAVAVTMAQKFYWNQGNAQNSAEGGLFYLPAVDHSTSTKGGQYMYTYNEEIGIGLTKLLSPIHDLSFGVHCLSFWYYRPNANCDEISVWIEDVTNKNVRKQLWTTLLIDNDNVKQWQFVQTTVAATNYFRISLEAKRKMHGKISNSVAVDDIRLRRGECRTIASCNFNDDLCGFIADTSNVTLRHGFGRVKNVENMNNNDETKYIPPTDSSDEKGLIVYSDFSDIKQETTNILLSDVLKPSKQSCLRFAYFLNGRKRSEISKFKLNLIAIGSSKSASTIFTDNQYSSEWKNKSIPISHPDSSFRFAFEMTGYAAGSIVALDNVKYTEGNCDEVKPPEESAIIKEQSCDFEDGFCSWSSSDSSGKTIWTIKGNENIRNKHPAYDISTRSNSGKYVYFDSSGTADGTLSSKPVKGSGLQCISFWYWINTLHAQYLKFKASVLNSNGADEIQTLFANYHKNSNGWHQTKRTFYTESIYSIAFYAECHQCVIAIDEINVYNGSCPETTTDYVNCDFENENCGFIPQDNDDIIWKRYKTDDVSAENFHNDASDQVYGHFIALDFGSIVNVTGKSRIYSP